MLSTCARGLHIAQPLLRLSILNCIVFMSVITPLYPPKASISLTICPFATPPIAGLQDNCAILLRFCVIKRTLEPRVEATYVASQPACPAPTTITSKSANIINRYFLFVQKFECLILGLPHLRGSFFALVFKTQKVQSSVNNHPV